MLAADGGSLSADLPAAGALPAAGQAVALHWDDAAVHPLREAA
jgi:hypothetical protein